jgi:hypothetical protein
MKKAVFVTIVAVTLVISCTPNVDPVPSPPPTPPVQTRFFLSKIISTTLSGQPVRTLDCIYGITPATTELISYYHYSMGYDTVNKLPKSFMFVSDNSNSYSAVYNASLLPVGGRKTSAFTGGNPASNTSNSDSLIYKTLNGRIIAMTVCNRSYFSYSPGGSGSSTDTSARVTISYINDNISKIHVDYSNGATRDLEYIYGTQKSPFYEARLKHLLNPDDDKLLELDRHFIDLFVTNEIISINKSETLSNGMKKNEKMDFSYTYNSAGYPLTAQASSSTGTILTQTFQYK